jgi:hypothetical protein
MLFYFQLNVLNDVIAAVLNSEPVIFSSNNWRLQEHLMDNISCLIKCCSSDVLYHKVSHSHSISNFNNISIISWQSVLLVEETRESGENHGPVASH